MIRPIRTMLLLSAATTAVPASAAEAPIANRTSFRIGDSGVWCTAQVRSNDPRLAGMFDRAYALSCRDAAGSVGSVLAVRRPVDLASEPAMTKSAALACKAEIADTISGVGAVRAVSCSDRHTKLDHKRYVLTRGRTTYFVEGLAGYDPALRLALASVVTDRPQPGTVQVATTEVSDAAAFARIQAGLLDSSSARAEAYARNNEGQFAQAAAFFDTIAARDSSDPAAAAEAIANQGLQQSNLSNFAGAERLFAAAEQRIPRSDGVLQRLVRNYRAINQLNQGKGDEAVAELTKPVAEVTAGESEELRGGLITMPLSLDINRDSGTAQQLSSFGAGLRPTERAAILDAQAAHLSAMAARQGRRYAEASRLLDQAQRDLLSVRDGKLATAGWLTAEIAVERGLLAEATGNRAAAAGSYDLAISALEQSYPESPMLLAARARKAGHLARSGNTAAARTLFGQVVEMSGSVSDSGTALRNLLGPYFDLLASEGSAQSAALMFRASQALQRPGVAQTQAVLARELSEGSDDASSLFRLATVRTRDIARTESEAATLAAKTAPTAQEMERLAAARASLDTMRAEQTALVAKLGAFPRYKVLAPQQTELSEIRGALRAGEAYYKMMIVGDRVFAVFATNSGARAIRLAPTRSMLADRVSTIRNSIARVENGATVTDSFNGDAARALYLDLFGTVDAEVQAMRHLVFEPDGAMLQLPPYLLITKSAGLDAYKARQAKPGADPYDMRGIDWLGRGRLVSISVSPRSFLDVRTLAPSTARQAYLGLGANAPVVAKPVAAVASECDWPVQTWQNPISPAELMAAEARFGSGASALMTGAAFTDTALLKDGRLDDYRILHFATHGLVTAPRPDCPPRPALVTSFGGPGSDGLLSFSEIFDLNLNADVVILSACDTAGAASVGASREAGLLTGGNYALDGLVRAFVGAGARSVVASHWPVPDDYNATQRLIGGLIGAAPGQPIAAALESAQSKLMDDANTSHPFYWAAFIILGDGAKALIPARVAGSAGSASGGR